MPSFGLTAMQGLSLLRLNSLTLDENRLGLGLGLGPYVRASSMDYYSYFTVHTFGSDIQYMTVNVLKVK